MRRFLAPILIGLLMTIAAAIVVWQAYPFFGSAPGDHVASPAHGQASTQTSGDHNVKGMPTRPSNPANRSLSNPEPIKVQLAGLTTYLAPLHANAPGRMPAREGDRAPGGVTLPPHPVLYARDIEMVDEELVAWLEAWAADSSSVSPESLGTALSQTRLGCVELYDVGRGVLAAEPESPWPSVFFEAAVRRADEGAFGSADEEAVIEALRQMARPLWQARKLQSCDILFGLLASREEEGSFLRRRAEFLHAETFYEMAREDRPQGLKSAAMFEALLETLPFNAPEGERAEFYWLIGCSYSVALAYEQSLAPLERAAAARGQYFANGARKEWAISLAMCGKSVESRREFELWVTQARPSESERASVEQWVVIAEQAVAADAATSKTPSS